VIERLTAAAALRQGCGAMMRRAATAGAVNGDPMVRIADLNAPAPMSGDIAAAQVEMACGNHAISLGLAIVISISGRQRMLSQKKTFKEACLRALGIAPDAFRAAPAKAAMLFDFPLAALTDGLPTVSIVKPPTAGIAAKLHDAQGPRARSSRCRMRSDRTARRQIARIEDLARADDPPLPNMHGRGAPPRSGLIGGRAPRRHRVRMRPPRARPLMRPQSAAPERGPSTAPQPGCAAQAPHEAPSNPLCAAAWRPL
jgi:hypothetical protein